MADIGLALGGVGSDRADGLQVTCVDRIGEIDSRALCGDGLLPLQGSESRSRRSDLYAGCWPFGWPHAAPYPADAAFIHGSEFP